MNKELLPFYILYKLSKADKKPKTMSEEDIVSFLKENQNDPDTKAAITEFSSKDVSEDTDFVDYMNTLQGEETQKAKNGAKLKYLETIKNKVTNPEFFKKGGKTTKKCKCGCNMIAFKTKGGKVMERCACGCKKQAGGEVTASDTIAKYNKMNTWADGYGPKSPVTGKVLNTKKEILNAARKEWKGKKVNVKK